MSDLKELRGKLDQLDDNLARLFIERLELVKDVAGIKAGTNSPIYDSQREREIINRVTKDLDDETAGGLKMLFTNLLDLSRSEQAKIIYKGSKVADKIRSALEETPRLFPKSAVVACQGTEGANSAAACEKLFARPSILYFNNFEGVFNAVAQGLCNYGILPIENSLHGSVTAIYDLMKKHSFHIVQSVKLKINSVMLVTPGAKLSDISTVYSHEQALAQCSEFLKKHGIKAVNCENTAIAAKQVAELGDKSVAAICSPNCAELYGLDVLDEQVQNSENNYTVFICISRNLEIYPGARKISLMMTVPHKPGSLYHLMSKFAALGINLTKLESRPLPDRDFEFMFYFDLDISVYDDAVFNLFTQLEAESDKFEFLGCYTEV